MTTRVSVKIVTHDDWEVVVNSTEFRMGEGWVNTEIDVLQNGEEEEFTIWDTRRLTLVERVRDKTND